MRIAIRVDATSQMGTGHFMRCLTLADGLRQRGAQIRFVSRRLPEHLQAMASGHDHELLLIDGSPDSASTGGLFHSSWLGTSQATDAEDTIRALSGQSWDWLVIDHYALDHHWEAELRGAAKKIMVIDDLADRRHDCDILLDQNYYIDMNTRYAGRVPASCHVLYGPRYALLREDFQRIHERTSPRTGAVKRILVSLGGVDADNHTSPVIAALADMNTSSLHVDVVIGAQHPFRKQIESACSAQAFVCHVQTDQMAELMAAADLAIGAGGIATWERCCLGLPTLTICVADNQRTQIADAAAEGLIYAPEMNNDLGSSLKRHLSALMENSGLRHVLSRNGMQTIDGRGSLRVIRHLGCTNLEIRTARPDDAKNVFEWRNHPAVRAVSRNTEMIDWESHRTWFTSVLAASDTVLLIGQLEDHPVGVVRFDIHQDAAEVSIYLVPGIREPGQGQELLHRAEQWLLANKPQVKNVNAQVLGLNKPSHRLFLAADYAVKSTQYTKRIHNYS